MTSIHFERVLLEDINWAELDGYSDRTVYQTREWLRFVQESQNAKPVILRVYFGGTHIGYFTGLVVRKFGLKVLGSPFPGWTTSYMGFNLLPGSPRVEVSRSLAKYAFEELGVMHLELMDRRLSLAEVRTARYEYRDASGYEIDLSRTEEELFSRMTSAARRCVRKADKSGVTVEHVKDIGDARVFAGEYYRQLLDVFDKQSLVPTYTQDRVEKLVEHVFPSGNLLLVRARSADGTCLATAVFPAFNDMMFFWGGASWRQHQGLRPNEAVQWYAMRHWKSRGIVRYDMGGRGEYKEKYGGEEIHVPFIQVSRYPFLRTFRNGANLSVKAIQKFRGVVKSRQQSHGKL